jgi:hypothetical protein
MTKTILQSAYESIWNKYDTSNLKELLDPGFHYQYDEDETECELLFIGANPSFKENGETLKTSYQRPTDNPLPYFRAFFNIQNELKEEYGWQGKWTHLDIFVFRKTDQKHIERKLLGTEHGKHFLYEQLMVAKQRIIHIKPKVIVVSNALARTFTGKERGINNNSEEYGVWMDFKFKFDKTLGTDVITEPEELKGVPVFFSSMLSGSGTLDKGSRERLIWHIDRALRNDL